jgi:hypothetical protein
MKHRALIPIESRLEGGVNRAKLKFTNINTTTSRVSVSNKEMSPRERVQNKSQANEQVRHGDLFYRGSVLANLFPVEEATKAGSLSTLPSLTRSTDRVSFLFSITWNTKFPQGPPQVWCLLPQFTSEFDLQRKNQEGRKQSKRKSSKEHKQITLSNHYGVVWKLERI